MSGSHTLHDFGILFHMKGFGVYVVNDKANRCTGRIAIKNPGNDLNPIFFTSRRSDRTLPRATAVEVVLNLCLCNGNPWRDAIHDDLQCRAIGLAGSRNAKHPAKCVALHLTLLLRLLLPTGS